MTNLSTSYPDSPEGQEIILYLKQFIADSPTVNTAVVNSETNQVIQNGFFLLRHLPMSRDIVFEFISSFYETFVVVHFGHIEGTDATLKEKEENILNEVHSSFVKFLERSGEIWSPILSTWALQLLGIISSKNAGRALFQRLTSVNEIIQVWIGSKAIQSLLDLTSRCLNCKDHANEDTFISALLDTSASHSPHFDWVVAHIGNSYPKVIVNKVLALGLQNFANTPPQVTIITSVVGILSHLAKTHSGEVQLAFDQLLQSALNDNTLIGDKFAIPYLLQLCASSDSLLDVLMDSAIPKITLESLQKLSILIPTWIELHFGGRDINLKSLITHILLKSSRGPKAINILIKEIKNWPANIHETIRTILNYFMAELSKILYENDSTVQKDFSHTWPCIQALKESSENILIPCLTDEDQDTARMAKQLVKVISLYNGEEIGTSAIVHLIQNSTNDKCIWQLIDIASFLELKYPNILSHSIQKLSVKIEFEKSMTRKNDIIEKFSSVNEEVSKLQKNEIEQKQIKYWINILRLIKTENFCDTKKGLSLKAKYNMRQKLCSVLEQNLSFLSKFLDVGKSNFSHAEASIILESLSLIPNPIFSKRLIVKNGTIYSMSFESRILLERNLIDFLFKTLGQNNKGEKLKQVSHVARLLCHLCSDIAIQNDSLRTLVQTCLNLEYGKLFIQFQNQKIKKSEKNANQTQSKFSMYSSLLKENQKRSANLYMSRVHSTSFISGKFSRGINLNKIVKFAKIENSDSVFNLRLFLGAILSVCMANPGYGYDLLESNANGPELFEVSVEAMRKVALLLVEIVSPDVMFNGLPWPDEDFSKVQVERDLQIKRAFVDRPYLWDLLEMVAFYSPSLCYCSVLLRALMATLMAHWTSCQDAKSRNSPTQLEWTIRLICVMKIGQLIPPPLSHIDEVVHELTGNEVLSLLKDIWAYMKMNVPVPTNYIRDPNSKKFVRNSDFLKLDPNYTEKLRFAILNNIEVLGHLYSKLFPTPPIQEL